METIGFGRFELRPQERRLLLDGRPVTLGARAFDLLVVLAERPGQMVGKQELLDRVWAGHVVEENNIAVQINGLRKLLGSDLIATVPGRGYRFIRPLDVAHALPSLSPPPLAPDPAEPAAAGLQTNLPRQLPPLLGRRDEFAALGALVDRHRLVSVTGSGGIGKTLLVQHLLDARRGALRHGVCWVELASVTDASALPGTLASALGVQPGPGSPLERLAAAVAPLDVLVALDNAEHLLAAVADLAAQLLDAASGLRLIVTSQAPLRLAGERLFRLSALAVPAHPMAADAALAFGAVALFVDRARAADARFALTDDNTAAVVELCRTLDGLPLAIEFAAARVAVLGVQRLAESMRDRLRMLTKGHDRNAPARQRTLRATLEWSHALLGPVEQTVFRRLAVVAGSASLELVQRVAADPTGPGAVDAWAVLDALGVLVERSLVAVVATDDADRPRYRLLESPRAFALERLVATGELEATRRRHGEALAQQFDAAWGDYFRGDVGFDVWRHRLSFDFDNAREAIAWSVGAPAGNVACAILPTLLHALPVTLRTERRELTETRLRLLDVDVPETLRARPCLLWFGGIPADDRRERFTALARRTLEAARLVDTRDGDRQVLYLAMSQWVLAVCWTDDRAAIDAALAEMTALEDPRWAAQCLVCGEVARFRSVGRGQAAAPTGEAARRWLALALAAGGSGALQTSMVVDAELAAGEVARAAAAGRALVASLEGGRDDYTLAYARLNLCAAALALDDVEQAEAVARDGWPQAARYEMQAFWGDYLALLAALRGRFEVAALLAGFADARYVATGDRRHRNEVTAFDRACRLARAALDPAAFERAFDEGAMLRAADVATAMFAATVPPQLRSPNTRPTTHEPDPT